jgi:hypothetical protein
MIKIIPDDACSKSIKPELRGILEIISEIYKAYGLSDFELYAANVHVNRTTNSD